MNDDLVVIPRETVYMIDKVVRQRASRARLFDSDKKKHDEGKVYS